MNLRLEILAFCLLINVQICPNMFVLLVIVVLKVMVLMVVCVPSC